MCAPATQLAKVDSRIETVFETACVCVLFLQPAEFTGVPNLQGLSCSREGHVCGQGPSATSMPRRLTNQPLALYTF